ncbi:peptidase M61 [Deefgea tanakiae]|uniref:Peptidase M61 n=1 Tax=Deefgea tanakiae TaxID=2865840 RepID=A0ABX8Z8T6_9NEIS|nr:peptidase M61 [Deefgea tanakiae]QZA78987.1 peptidase M61 [Deefgea tanakiae]
MTIHYKISPYDSAAHLFLIDLTISSPNPDGQLVYLPTWIPGSYLIREFAKNIVSIEAMSQGEPVALRKMDKASWQAAAVSAPLTISCIVYANDLSVRGAYLDSERGFFNGTSVFLAVKGQEQDTCSVEIIAPAQIKWRLATTLGAVQVDDSAFGLYQAKNYDELIDHPVEMADFAEVAFQACGVPHRLVISGRHQADLSRLARDLQRICEYQIQFFGTPAPFKEYVFLTLAVGDGYGGLEHRSSTALICKRNDLPLAHETEIKPGYLQFLGLCSHEYFHSWNVKRIKPAAYAPYDLQQESYSRLLWAFEGITSYYDDLTLVRTGLITQQTYLDLLSQSITNVERGQGRLVQNLEDASFDAWVKYYRQDENSPNALVSYYTKGALFALCLDLTIRQKTLGAKSLDDVMRALWQRFGVCFEQNEQGVTEEEWECVAQQTTGVDLSSLFNLGLRTTTELPLRELLADVGVEWQQRVAVSSADKGGWQEAPKHNAPSLGGKTAAETGGVKLTQVFTDGAAQLAGLSAGDVLFAWNGLRLTIANLEQFLSSAQLGEKVRIHAFRRDELMVFDLSVQAALLDTVGLKVVFGLDVGFLNA